MNIRRSLKGASRELLLDFIIEQQRLIQSLEGRIQEQNRQIQSLQAQVRQLQNQLPPAQPRWIPWFKKPPKVHPKPPGQKPGHPGITRTVPQRIDRVVTTILKRCPDCRHRLGDPVAVTEHRQEDVIPARVEVTCFKRSRYYCRHCRRVVTAAAAPQEIPHSSLGPHLLTETLLLRYVHGLPFKNIRQRFQETAHLTVSTGALAQGVQRLARWLSVDAEELLKQLRVSPVIHADETGWKITGQNHWLWAFVTDRLAAFTVDRSRGSKVPLAVLGSQYSGVVVSDFHNAYNLLPGHQQKCWVHLLRELHRCGQRDASAGYAQAHRGLRRIFRDACRLNRHRSRLPPTSFQQKRSLLSQRLWQWGTQPYATASLKRLAKRIRQRHAHLLTFLDVPGLSADNNHAERLIRPHVILRNRSYQSRSPTGAQTHAQLMSLVQTLQLQDRAVGETLREAYLRHRHGDFTPVAVSES